MILYYLMPVIFIVGILMIAFEDVIRINKAATAVGMSILLWLIFLLDAVGIFSSHPPVHLQEFLTGFPAFAELSVAELAYKFIEFRLVESLGDVATTLFFVLGSMAIIDIVDSHGGFDIITSMIRTQVERKLLWILSFITFFLSVLLGNLATVIVMIAIARKLIPERNPLLGDDHRCGQRQRLLFPQRRCHHTAPLDGRKYLGGTPDDLAFAPCAGDAVGSLNGPHLPPAQGGSCSPDGGKGGGPEE